MEQVKLNKIIAEKNEQLERDTLRIAEILIEAIAKDQQDIERLNKNIAKNRAELKELTVKQLDAQKLLGE